VEERHKSILREFRSGRKRTIRGVDQVIGKADNKKNKKPKKKVATDNKIAKPPKKGQKKDSIGEALTEA
jgi:hypothetical protein